MSDKETHNEIFRERLSAYLEKILKNWKPKLICLTFAVGFFVWYRLDMYEKVSFSVPLETRASGSLVLKNGCSVTGYVTVTVDVDKKQNVQISAEDFSAFIDFTSQSKPGKYNFDVHLQPSAKVYQYRLQYSVYPETVEAEVEDEFVRYVKVTPTISGQAAYGYETGVISVSPSTVRVRGPRSTVEGLSEIQTENIDIEGLSNSKEIEAGLLASDLISTYVDIYDKVTVSVPVSQIGASKTFKNLKIEFDNLDSVFSIKSGDYTVDITVEGTQLDLDKLKNSSFVVSADCSTVRESGKYDLSVFVFHPDDVNLVSQSVESITVFVEDKVYVAPNAQNFEEDDGL